MMKVDGMAEEEGDPSVGAEVAAAAASTPPEQGAPEGVKPAGHRKKRRPRKRSKGESVSAVVAVTDEAAGEVDSAEVTARQPRTQVAHDPAVLAHHAWKIYLAEISEEGVALVDDGSAKDLAKRCFRLAEIFLNEAKRHG